MALTAAVVSAEPRSYSIGPWKEMIFNFTVANGDTTGTITCAGLSEVIFAHASGIVQTAAPTFSGNVVTLTFVDPAATRHGQLIVRGR